MRSGSGVRGAVSRAALAALLLFAIAPGVYAARNDRPHAGRHGVFASPTMNEARGQSGISKDQAIEIAERRYKARVVRAEASESNGRRVYVLRLLSDEGRVWTVRIDSETGSEL